MTHRDEPPAELLTPFKKSLQHSFEFYSLKYPNLIYKIVTH